MATHVIFARLFSLLELLALEVGHGNPELLHGRRDEGESNLVRVGDEIVHSFEKGFVHGEFEDQVLLLELANLALLVNVALLPPDSHHNLVNTELDGSGE